MRPFRAKPIARSTLLIGYIDAQLGLGQSMRGLALALARTTIAFRIYPFGIGVEGRRVGNYMPERYDEVRAHTINVVEVSPDELPHVFKHVSPSHFDRSYTILRAYWELEKAPDAWRADLEHIDEIWTPTEFVTRSFAPIFDRTITVIPPAVETPHTDVDGHARFGLQPGLFYYLFSFDYYSRPARKNPEAVLKAFRQAFPNPTIPAGLIIKSTGAVGHYPELRAELLLASEQDPRITIIDETTTRPEMLALIKATDCYVSLHRAEGFGLGMVEAMTFGKPVIATDYSGSTDFLTEETGYPIPYRLIPVGPHDYVHAEDQVWADASVQDCAATMRYVFDHQVEAAAKARHGQMLVEARYSPASVGCAAEKRLNEIFEMLARQSGGRPRPIRRPASTPDPASPAPLPPA